MRARQRLAGLVLASALVAVASPAAAWAGQPAFDLYPTVSQTATVETLTGTVYPQGLETTYEVSWGTASSAYCSSATGAGRVGSLAPVTIGGDENRRDFTVDMTGLTPGADYCVVLSATNADGSERRSDGFRAGDPASSLERPYSTGATTAGVEATINPAAQPTTHRTLYGVWGSNFCDFPESAAPPMATSPSSASQATSATVTLSGLTRGERYCVVLETTNASGTTRSFFRTFVAGLPHVANVAAAASGQDATITAGVNPAGQATTYRVLWRDRGTGLCSLLGDPDMAIGQATPAQSLPADSQVHPISATLEDLPPGDYCANVRAENATGATVGTTRYFTIAPPVSAQPQAFTNTATAIDADGALLTGSVSPANATLNYRFEWDAATSSFCQGTGAAAHTTDPQPVPADEDNHPVSSSITGLAPETDYCFRLVAEDATHTYAGGLQTFSTDPFDDGLGDPPQATTLDATGITAGTATLRGTVDPAGAPATYNFEWDVGTSPFCSDSDLNEPTYRTATGSAGSGDSYQASAAITGLASSTQYCYRIVAFNNEGGRTANLVTFTTSAPSTEKPPADDGGGGGGGGGNSGSDAQGGTPDQRTGSGGGGPVGPGTTPSGPQLASFGVRGKVLLSANRRGKITVDTGFDATCPAGAGTCTGAAEVVTSVNGKRTSAPAAARARRVVLGKATLKVAAGKTTGVKLVLSKQGAALLRKRGNANVRITVSLKPPAAAATSTSRTAKLRAPKPRR